MTRGYSYRLRDDAGRVLYVGCTADPNARLVKHVVKPWGSLIASMDVTVHASRYEARVAEATQIDQYQPPYNIEHTQKKRELHGVRIRQILTAIRDLGEATQTEIEHLLVQRGFVDKTPNFAGAILARLVLAGVVVAATERPAKSGPRKTAKVYALNPGSEAAA